MSLSFHSSDVEFVLKNKNLFRKWINDEILNNFFIPGQINIIFCSDEYLLEINKKYLNHDFYTDIITFNYNKGKMISGDLFISIDRLKENAYNFKTEFLFELKRVTIHGVLHLLGNDDSSPEQKSRIRILEDDALQRFPLS